MIRGETKNIALSIGANKNSDPIDSLVPSEIDRRNGQMTEAGNWKRRPGYADQWDLGNSKPVHLLIPDANGFAITGDGKVYQIEPSVARVGTAQMTGSVRPTYTLYQATSTTAKSILLADGGTVMKLGLAPTALAALGGSPPNFKFIDTLDTRAIGCGHNDIGFRWSDLENTASWPAANTNSVLGDGEIILNFRVLRRDMYFFKTKSIEVWSNIGTSTVYARKAYIEKGIGSSYSLVHANDNFYWLNNDWEFSFLEGLSPKVISTRYAKEIRASSDKADIYGFDFPAERLIRWFAPGSNKCFVFDYVTNIMSEDNAWNGSWLRMPINSYMERDGEAYIGDLEPTGKIYRWSRDYLDDNGSDIRLYRRFAAPLGENGGEYRANRLRFRIKRGNGTNTEMDPKAIVAWRIDQGERLTEDIDLGAVGEHDPYVDINNLGIGREIELEIIETDAVDYLMTHAYLTAERLGA